MAIDQMANKIIKRGEEKSRLGRWAWVSVKGEENKKVRIVSA